MKFESIRILMPNLFSFCLIRITQTKQSENEIMFTQAIQRDKHCYIKYTHVMYANDPQPLAHTHTHTHTRFTSKHTHARAYE